jgi:hypothetical protein
MPPRLPRPRVISKILQRLFRDPPPGTHIPTVRSSTRNRRSQRGGAAQDDGSSDASVNDDGE